MLVIFPAAHPRPSLGEGVSSVCAVAQVETIEGGEVGGIELELARGHVLLEVRDRARARYQEHPVVAGEQPRERDLARRGPVLVGDLDDGRVTRQARLPAGEGRTEREEWRERDLVLPRNVDQRVVPAVNDAVPVLDLATSTSSSARRSVAWSTLESPIRSSLPSWRRSSSAASCASRGIGTPSSRPDET